MCFCDNTLLVDACALFSVLWKKMEDYLHSSGLDRLLLESGLGDEHGDEENGEDEIIQLCPRLFVVNHALQGYSIVLYSQVNFL